jgi:integrase/recombinase XerD
MKRPRVDSLLRLVESFFRQHLQLARAASRHTVDAYRDALRLFFLFVADQRKCSVAKLCLDDVTVERVEAFLDYLERVRHNKPSTRNGRLAALKSFAHHLVRHDPTRAGQYQRILSLSAKKARRPVIAYLEPQEVHLILKQIDRRTRWGARDYALILFMYNTAARVSEVLQVRAIDIQLRRPYQVRIQGKGNKDRIVILWPATVAAIRRLLVKPSLSAANALFQNARGEDLSRDGVAYILRRYVNTAARRLPTLRRKIITPHTLRHSSAAAMIQAGIDITVIRDILGHESIVTTNRYVKTNLQMRRQALEAFWASSGLVRPRANRWKPSPALLALLESL